MNATRFETAETERILTEAVGLCVDHDEYPGSDETARLILEDLDRHRDDIREDLYRTLRQDILSSPHLAKSA